jgi:hypothetical protein
MCRLYWNLGASTYWNPQALSRPVMGLLYLLHISTSFMIKSLCRDIRSVVLIISRRFGTTYLVPSLRAKNLFFYNFLPGCPETSANNIIIIIIIFITCDWVDTWWQGVVNYHSTLRTHPRRGQISYNSRRMPDFQARSCANWRCLNAAHMYALILTDLI